MHGIVDRVLIGHEAEIAELGADVRLGDALDGVLVVESLTNQIGDRAELETVLARELFQIRTTCHRAVLVEDLDDHGRRPDTRPTREITARPGNIGSASLRERDVPYVWIQGGAGELKK